VELNSVINYGERRENICLKINTILELTRRKDNEVLNHPLEIDSKEDQKLPVLKL